MEKPQALIDSEKRIEHLQKLTDLFREANALLRELIDKKAPNEISQA